MLISRVALLTIGANITLAVFAMALVILALWRKGWQRRGNEYFAMCMLIFACYGVSNALGQVTNVFDELDPRILLFTSTSLYIAGAVLLFNFVITFAELPNRIRRIEHILSGPVILIALWLVWTERIYVAAPQQTPDEFHYHITNLGIGFVLIGFIYMLIGIGRLYRQRSTKAQELGLPMIVMILGAISYLSGAWLRSHAINAIALTMAVIMLGRVLLKYQVFDPLVQLNAELDLKNKELEEATTRKTQFLANMSHELRTPLNSIIGYTDLVVNRTYGDLSEIQVDRLQKVSRNGRLLLELINDVLDLSKIEAGKMELSFSRVPTSDLLDNLLALYEPRATEKKLRLVKGYSQLPAMWVDETRARQIFSNLLSNAIKFTNEGVVIVRGHFDEPAHQVVISITDTGIGIDGERSEKIFEAFYANTTSAPQEGTRLGLALARRLSELHSGRLWFNSVLGKGTTFHVSLPAADNAYEPAPLLWPRMNNRGPVILAIDDDTEAIEVLQGQLESHDFLVYGACSPNDALRLAHDLHPALITLDVMMPGMDGWEVLAVLRSDPDTAEIPIIVLTATDERQKALGAGANAFLRKPIQPAPLLEQIHMLLTAREEEA
jgi:signal transduction histidine kinase/CheY-like chemotaxis protein